MHLAEKRFVHELNILELVNYKRKVLALRINHDLFKQIGKRFKFAKNFKSYVFLKDFLPLFA